MAIKKLLTFLLVYLLSAAVAPSPVSAQNPPTHSDGAQETVQASPAPAPQKGAKQKSSSASSPKQQIKEGGKEIGEGFKNLWLGIGRGFKNMGKAIQKAWTGGKDE